MEKKSTHHTHAGPLTRTWYVSQLMKGHMGPQPKAKRATAAKAKPKAAAKAKAKTKAGPARAKRTKAGKR